MSQGDPTFNATLKIKVLLRELDLSRRPESGYTEGYTGTIIDAIETIRERADAAEMGWSVDEKRRLENQLEHLRIQAENAHMGPFVNSVTKAGTLQGDGGSSQWVMQGGLGMQAPPPGDYQQAANVPPYANGVNGLGFSGD